MAKNKGWWNLEIQGNRCDELTEYDLEHIGEQIKQGCTGGEIIKDEE